MTRRARAVVLCEDKAHWHFIRAFLVAKGWNKRQISARVSPAGRGAARQWVMDKFSEELNTYRSKSRDNICLIVMIDGDRQSPEERIAQFREKTSQAEIAFRDENERTAIFVPNRNLETWFAWLDGREIDEDRNFKLDYLKGAKRAEFGRKMARICEDRSEIEGAPNSLASACNEWGRIRS